MPPGTTPAAVRSRGPWYVAFLAVLACPSSASAQIDYAAIRATKVVEAIQIEESIVLDGRLDEAAWARAPIAHDFYQQEPSEGALATEPSEVRFVYDADAIYVGGTFYDTDQRGGVINELKRDFSPRDGDTVSVIFDPFLDLNAWSFQVNPAGSLRDAQRHTLRQCRHIAVISFDGPLNFASASYLEDEILSRVAEQPDLKLVLIAAAGISEVDASGEETLRFFYARRIILLRQRLHSSHEIFQRPLRLGRRLREDSIDQACGHNRQAADAKETSA